MGENAGIQQGLIHSGWHFSCRLCWSQCDLEAVSGWVCGWELCWRRPGCPRAVPHFGQTPSCPPLTLSSGQERCRLPPTALGALGMLMLHQGQNGSPWALCSIPMPACCHCPPQLCGNGSWGWSMPNFTFQMGFLAPGQAAFRVVKYFGKPHLSFSLKRLLLGKRRRAELPARSWHGGEHSSARHVLNRSCWCWGALASWLGGTRVTGEQRKGQKKVFQGDCKWFVKSG